MSSSDVGMYNTMRGVVRQFADLISELESFVRTRGELFRAEITQKLPRLSTAAMLGGAGALLLVTGYLFLALALVILIGTAFPQSPYRWFFGFVIVGVVSLGFGAAAAFVAKSQLELKSIKPERTLEVLKSDKDWIRKEIEERKSDVRAA